MAFNEFADNIPLYGSFIVKNISSIRKTIQIFNNPIYFGAQRDLLKIRGVSEADIRASLLKGELQHKIRAQEIVIIKSDIDLLQFNMEQRAFLLKAGIVLGVDAINVNPNPTPSTTRVQIIETLTQDVYSNNPHTIPDGYSYIPDPANGANMQVYWRNQFMVPGTNSVLNDYFEYSPTQIMPYSNIFAGDTIVYVIFK